MTLWAESFNKFYPNAKIQIEGKGSSTAPPALISGTAQLGPMSREMKGTEIDAVREEVRLQADPDPHLGRRAGGLRQQGQPDQVPDASRRWTRSSRSPAASGYKEDITTWGQLGLTGRLGEQADQPLRPQLGLRHLRLLQGARAQERRLQGRGQGAAGLGLGGPGRHRRPLRHRLQRHRLRDRRRPRRPARREGGRQVLRGRPPTTPTAGSYPLARFLYVYVNKAPGKPLDPLTREFVKLILSKEGQEVVIKDGYFPIPAAHRQGRARRRSSRWRSTPTALRAGGPAIAGSPARRLAQPGRRGGSSSTAGRRDWSSPAASSSSPRSWPSSFVIAAEVYPLFKQPTADVSRARDRRSPQRAPPAPALPGVDEYREVAYAVSAGGVLEFVALEGRAPTWPACRSPGWTAPGSPRWRGLGKGRHAHRHLRRPRHSARDAVRGRLQGRQARA